MNNTRFEKLYCDDCMATHWVEVTSTRKEICHGKNFIPKDTPTHYTRWKAGGIELCEKVYKSPAQMPIEWQMAEERENAETYIK